MIKHVSLDHGWYYFFRLHTEMLGKLPPSLSNLNKYLEEVFENCPDHHFKGGPRSSKLKIDLGIETEQVENHPVSSYAGKGLQWSKYKTNHSKVQVYMLENDPMTFAVEAPIWMEASETDGFEDFFETDEPLSGHIDLLRFEDGKIWVWDFKPSAHKEKYATTQTYFYALMLSLRTGIPLDRFMCGYFDEENTYVYKPEASYLEEIGLNNPLKD